MHTAVVCPHCRRPCHFDAQPGRVVACPGCNGPIRLEPDAGPESTPARGIRHLASEVDVPAEWAVGDILLDRYQVTAVLGEGSLGRVYKVHHLRWGTPLVVKSPRVSVLELPGLADALVREAEAWVRLGFETHFAGCYYVRVLGGIPRLFLEYVEGGTLADALRDRRLYRGGPAKALEPLIDISIQAAWGLHFLHEQGGIHQDVKPSNLLLTPDGTVKITDPGLSRALMQARAAACPGVSQVSEASPYAAPEQLVALRHAVDEYGIERRVRLTRHADIWSWALCVLELFCGELPPVQGAGARLVELCLARARIEEGMPRMPEGVSGLLARCLAGSPDDRPRDLGEVAEGLERVYQAVIGKPYPRKRMTPAQLMADGLNNQAVALLDLGQLEPAIATLERALAADPLHLYARYNQGLLSWRAGRQTDDAFVRQMREVRAAYTESWEDEYLLGCIHLERGEGEAAREVLEAALRQVADQPEATERIERVLALVQAGGRCVGRFQGHEGDVLGIALSPDGRTAFTAGADTSVRVWELSSGQCRQILWEDYKVQGIAATPDATVAVTAPVDGWSLQVWDLKAARRSLLLQGHTDVIRGVALSPDGRLAVSAGRDRTLRVWNLATGESLRTLEGHTDEVHAVALSQDVERAVSASRDRTLKVWDVVSGQCLRTLEGHTDPVWSVALTGDGRVAVSGGNDKTVRVWEVATGRCLQVLKGHSAPVKGVAVSGDGRWAISVSRDDTLRLWDLIAGRCVRTSGAFGVIAVAMTPDAQTAVSSHFREIRLWQVGAAPCAAPIAFAPPRRNAAALVNQRAFNAALGQARTALDQKDWKAAVASLVAARDLAGYDRAPEALALWDQAAATTGRGPLRDIWLERVVKGPGKGHAHEVTAAALTPDGRLALSLDSSGVLKAWEVSSGRELWTRDGQVGAAGIAVTPDGRQFITAGQDDALRIRDLETGHTRQLLKDLREPVTAVALNAEGSLLAYACGHGIAPMVRMLRVGESRFAHILQGHDGPITTLAMTPDARIAVTASVDRTLRVWDLFTGRCQAELEGHSGPVTGVALTPDARLAVSAGEDGTARVWELSSSQCLHTLREGGDAVMRVAVTPDGRLALTGDRAGSIRLWDLEAGRCLKSVAAHSGPVTAVDLAWSARAAVSAGVDRTLRVWRLDWDLAPRAASDWDEGARPWLRTFLAAHSPLGEKDPVGLAAPAWVEPDLEALWRLLQGGGLGWLRQEGVIHELERMKELTVARLRGATNRQGQAARALAQVRAAIAREDWRGAVSELSTVRSMPEHERAAEVLELWADVSQPAARGAFKQAWEQRRLMAEGMYRVAMPLYGRLAITGGFRGMVAVWDMTAGRLVRQLQGPPGAPQSDNMVAVYIAQDGQLAGAVGEGGVLYVWEVATGKCRFAWGTPLRKVKDACFAAAGRIGVMGGEDGTIVLLDASSGKCLRALKGHDLPIEAVAATPDGRRVVSVGSDRTLRVWDTRAGTCVQSLTAHSDLVTRVAVRSDGQLAVSCSFDRTLRVWDLLTGRVLRALEAHTDAVRDVAMSADGRLAVSAGQDAAIRLWDLKTGACVHAIEGAQAHRERVRGICMTPDARQVASLSRDGTLRLWHLEWELRV